MAKMNISQFDTRSAKRSTRLPVQTPIPEAKQVLNSTGGYVWEVSDWDRLNRFLILGSEGGTYYVGEQDLTKQNHDAFQRCLAEDEGRAVRTIVDISTQGRAYRNEPALFLLALAAADKRAAVRDYAFKALPLVARTGTHLFHFMDYVTKLRGTGRALRNAIRDWYTNPKMLGVEGGRFVNADGLAYQLVKYQQRDGWSHKDLLRLGHPHAVIDAQDAAFRWAVGGMEALGTRSVQRKASKTGISTYPDVREHLPKLIEAFEQAKTANEKTLVKLITEHNLPREAVPTEKLNSATVWEALLQKMPMTATIRSLAKMTAVGLVRPLTEASKLIVKRLGDAEYIRKSRIHPIQILVASKIYAQGRGDKGSLTWTAVPAIVTALDQAFYLAFGNVRPCGKPLLIALDVSGSMSSSAAGATPLMACEVTAAFALVHLNVEEECHVMAFNSTYHDLGIRKGMSLEQATKRACENCGNATDISLSIKYAMENRLKIGGLVTMTDNEVNTGTHPALAVREYRNKMVPDFCNVMAATTATPFTCNDPNDRFGLDVCGFDTSAPSVMADFIRGEAPAEAATSEE
jgi:60 kDa SS-A/Ro ribonucleoprotein